MSQSSKTVPLTIDLLPHRIPTNVIPEDRSDLILRGLDAGANE